MKRIINMGPDVYPGLDPAPKMFAVWCTVNDRFEELDGTQDWESADELESDFNRELEKLSGEAAERLIARRDRCVSLARGSGY